MTRTRSSHLLAELHAHTTWSDGAFSVPALVDLYGARGFDVLCVTDHVCRSLPGTPRGITRAGFDAYLAEIEREAERAREQFGLLVVPGLELTYDDPDPRLSAHALALGLRSFVSVDRGIDEAIETAVQAGAALVAAHPFDDEPASNPGRLTQRFARDPELAARVHRFELFNRTQIFAWVAQAGLPCVASGDFHRLEHLHGWKSVVPCARDEEALVAHLRSRRPVFITEVGATPERAAA
ncbi:MAG TPA: PHP domain-containing protein [Gaiellaceae bacterium]|nr:PHP domain-containing protein [Gaiellaceae bacterium]